MSSSSRSESDQDRHRGSDEFAATSILRVNGASHRSGDGYSKPKWIASPESSESEAGCRCIYQHEHEAKGHTSPAPNAREQLVLRTSERERANEGERGRAADTKPRAASRNRRTKTERADEIERGSSVRFGIPDEIDSQNDFSSDASASTITNSHYGELKHRNARVDSERNSQPKVEQIDACDSVAVARTDAAINQKAKTRGSTVTIMAVGNSGTGTAVRVNRAASSTHSEAERNGKSEPMADEANCVRARSASRTSTPHADSVARSARAEANENQTQNQNQTQSRPATANRSRSANVHLARGRRQQSLDIQPETSIPWQLQMQTTSSEPQFPFSIEQRSLARLRDAPASLTSSVLSVGSSASSASVVLEVKKMTLERSSFDERFGFTVFRQKGHLVVASVDANSEAWLQGLRVGDRILKLNRLQAKETGFVDAVQTIASSLRLALYVASKRQPEFSGRLSTAPKRLDLADDQRENYFKCVLSSSSGYFGFALAKKRSAPTQIFIAVIDIPSPAHSAGLRENDTLVQVNGIDITAMDYTKLISILRTSPSVALLVKRE